jgi:hypothetical protein
MEHCARNNSDATVPALSEMQETLWISELQTGSHGKIENGTDSKVGVPVMNHC